MFLAVKTKHGEGTAKVLDEIERAGAIFRKMCDDGGLEQEFTTAKTAKRAAVSVRRILR